MAKIRADKLRPGMRAMIRGKWWTVEHTSTLYGVITIDARAVAGGATKTMHVHGINRVEYR
ncbi:hypothetical protein [Sciscionella marina]|uniref:hypothetical protein n=1 Tax=Sciscionella marina TaxID=508770 RepID=UPI0003668D79|nr:hypothetical protein [Sciscionella marina]